MSQKTIESKMKNRHLAQIVSDGEVQSHTDDLKKNYHTLRSERSSTYKT